MFKRICGCLLAGLGAAPAWADSLTLGALADDDDGRSVRLSGHYSPVEALALSASVGHSRARLNGGGEEFSGNSVGLGADVSLGAFFASVSGDRWKDSNQLRSTVLNTELGWMSTTGIALSALMTDRDMRVTYETTVLGQTRQRHIDFAGTGFGADLSYFGELWTASARYLDYDYGHSVQRVRAALESPNTDRFPRVDQLLGSIATRAAGTPDHDLSLLLGRQFARTSLSAALQWQRDALTGEKMKSADLTFGWKPAQQLGIDVSAGASKGAAGTAWWAGCAVTLYRAKSR